MVLRLFIESSMRGPCIRKIVERRVVFPVATFAVASEYVWSADRTTGALVVAVSLEPDVEKLLAVSGVAEEAGENGDQGQAHSKHGDAAGSRRGSRIWKACGLHGEAEVNTLIHLKEIVRSMKI